MIRAPVPAIDVHTHLFPERLALAVRRALTEMYGWDYTLPMEPREFHSFVSSRGTERFCLLPYAHKPGMARSLNEWIAKTAAELPGAIGFACVHQDDEDRRSLLEDAFSLGLRGVKIHHQVQQVAPADPRLFDVYELMLERDLPLLVHAGKGPTAHPATGFDKFRELMRRFPDLKICVAHLGFPERAEFIALLDEHPRLYLDTSGQGNRSFEGLGLERHADRILFGTDAPNIPYDYDLAISRITDLRLGDEFERKVFRENALAFLGEL